MSDFMERHFSHLRDGRKEYTEAEVRLIIEGAILEEREACARLANQIEYCGACESDVAKAIRARGQA